MSKSIIRQAFLAVALLSTTVVFAQKTATSIITDVLRMNGVSGQALGYEIRVTVPDLIQGADFIIMPADIREKLLNSLSTAKIKFFSNKAASSTNLSASTSNSLLSLSEPGLTSPTITTSLGTLTFYPSNPSGSEIKVSLPSNLSVLEPTSTTAGGILFGKATCTVKNSSGTTTTFSRVVFFRAKHYFLPG